MGNEREDKIELRKQCAAWRNGIDREKKAAADASICRRILSLSSYRFADTVLLYYTDPASDDKKRPGRIPDREMDIFRIATSLASTDPDAMYLGSDTEKLCTGDRVRVTDGLYKGTEGYVKRVRHARKVLVAIKGVAVVALSNIPLDYLEKINE